jgi:hypothetical protein
VILNGYGRQGEWGSSAGRPHRTEAILRPFRRCLKTPSRTERKAEVRAEQEKTSLSPPPNRFPIEPAAAKEGPQGES